MTKSLLSLWLTFGNRLGLFLTVCHFDRKAKAGVEKSGCELLTRLIHNQMSRLRCAEPVLSVTEWARHDKVWAWRLCQRSSPSVFQRKKNAYTSHQREEEYKTVRCYD
jgi:hypothetical protein